MAWIHDARANERLDAKKLSRIEVREKECRELVERAIPDMLADQPDRLSKFHEQLAGHKANWGFECLRWGDFLCLEIARPISMYWHYYGQADQKMSMALSLRDYSKIRLDLGKAPDCSDEDRITCTFMREDLSDCYFQSERTPLPKSLQRPGCSGRIWHQFEVMSVSGIAKAYTPDVISFCADGKDAYEVNVPFGLGESVYRKILAALADGAPKVHVVEVAAS